MFPAAVVADVFFFFLIQYFKAVMVVSVEEVSSSLVREYLSRKVGKAMANV